MDTNATIYYPDWQTQACAIHITEIGEDGNPVENYALFSYDTCICVYKEYKNGLCEVVFNTEGYHHSATTSKHFRWFIDMIVDYDTMMHIRALMSRYKSVAAFLGAYITIRNDNTYVRLT